MKKALLPALTTLLFLSGCVIVKPKANSTIEYSIEGNTDEVGLRDAYWEESSEGIELIAYGWHPKEHKTYVFFINEGYPAHDPRLIYLKEENREYRIQFYLRNELHTGTLTKLKKVRKIVSFNLSDVSWDSKQTIIAKGNIRAKNDSGNEMKRLLRIHQGMQNQAVQSTPANAVVD